MKIEKGINCKIHKSVKIQVEELSIGNNVVIGPNVFIKGKSIFLNNDVTIENNCQISIIEKLVVKSRSRLGPYFNIKGVNIEIGIEFWSGNYCTIGGGSCFEIHSKLKIGYWGHLGDYGFINTARSVNIGNEVGMGIRTCIFTHGAYQSVWNGFPVNFDDVNIGDNCWLPGAIVNPGVNIGKNCVVAVGSIVTKSFPEGALIGGVPAKIIKEKAFPKKISKSEKLDFMKEFLKIFSEILNSKFRCKYQLFNNFPSIDGKNFNIQYVPIFETIEKSSKSNVIYIIDDEKKMYNDENITIFNLNTKIINGPVNEITKLLQNQLRRYGIRFKSFVNNNEYVGWK